MPLIYKDSLSNGSIIGVWQITESVEELLGKIDLSIKDTESLILYKHENRKKQWLSYRVLIKELISEAYHISYSDFGKPFLNIQTKNNHLSITHSGDHSAVIINENFSVGIDMEKPAKRIERVSERFLSDDELKFIDDKNKWDHLTICWTVKEALFKIHGNLCYDFREQIMIDPFGYASQGQVNCTVLGDKQQHNYKVDYRKMNDYYMAYVTA
jgi:phosphopantetheinyl transferase